MHALAWSGVGKVYRTPRAVNSIAWQCAWASFIIVKHVSVNLELNGSKAKN